MTPDERVGVLIPVKSFRAAKARLAGALSPDERVHLARTMATAVVAAAAPLPVHVVCDDEEVADWARQAGAGIIWKPGRGLNGAVADGFTELGEAGFDRIIVAHADLPHAVSFDLMTHDPGVVIVPDRHDDGTNVISLPAGCAFRFEYGPGSCARHRAGAQRLGLPVTILRDARLGWDVDRPADLEPPDWSLRP
jgi:2-phospho-L-lactate guanylyltransferase